MWKHRQAEEDREMLYFPSRLASGFSDSEATDKINLWIESEIGTGERELNPWGGGGGEVGGWGGGGKGLETEKCSTGKTITVVVLYDT